MIIIYFLIGIAILFFLLSFVDLTNSIKTLRINLFKFKYFFVVKKKQIGFYYYENFNEKIRLDNKIYYKLNNFLFYKNKKNNLKFNKNIKSIILVYFNKDKKFFNYKIGKKKFSRLISNNSFNFFKIKNENFSKKIITKDNSSILNSFYVKKKEPKNLVLIILLDGLSKDLSKKLIYSKKFFNKSNIFNNFWSNSPWTLPTFGNLSTGLRTSNHLCFKPDSYYRNNSLNQFERERLKSKITIFEYFKSINFITGCYSPYVRINPTYNFNRGVDIFKFCEDQDSNSLIDDIISHLETFKDKSNFIFTHLFDLHHNLKGFNDLSDYAYFDEKNYDFKSILESEKKNKHKFLDEKNFYEEKIAYSILKRCDLRLEQLYNYISNRNYDDYTIILMGDHGTKFKNVNKTSNILYKYHQNVGFLIKDKKVKSFKNKINNFSETIDILPSFIARYGAGNLNKYNFDGQNTLFGNKVKNYVLSENIYEKNYNSLIFDKKNFLYSSYELNEKTITSFLEKKIYDANEKQLHIKDYSKFKKILNIEKKHLKSNRLKKKYERKN